MKKEEDFQDVLDQLGLLAPSERQKPIPKQQMFVRIKQAMANEPSIQQPRWWETWVHTLFAPSRRLTLTAVSLVLLFVLSFTFPAVRAAASNFLGIFRVEKFAAISISPEQIALIDQIANSGLKPGELEFIDEPGAGTAVTSLREAAQLTGMRDILTSPELGEANHITVSDGGTALFTLNLEESRAIFELVGADPSLLPNEIDQADIRIFIYNGISQEWADGSRLLQTQSPVVEYPVEIDPTILGEALLQVLGLSQAEASRLAQQIDWTSTLVLPIPTDLGTFQEVSVRGVSGLYIRTIDGSESGIIWQKDGYIYSLMGKREMATLLALANGLE